tara:strand:- start:502 stop:837 length:336 start_codon:yes stop_codon:yes gene_type:complete
MTTYVFKILNLKDWIFLKKNKYFLGSKLDKISGYIHLCSKNQLRDTLNIYFSNHTKVVVLKFLHSSLKAKIKWEKSRNENLFPHYYGILNFKKIIQIKEIRTKTINRVKVK